MLHGLLAGGTQVGVHFEEDFHELQGFLVHFAQVDSFQGLWLADLRDLDSDEPGVLVQDLPLPFRDVPQHLLDLVQLVYLILSWE